MIFYIYIGYPILISMISIFRNKRVKKGSFIPYISILIAAYNEEKKIGQIVSQRVMEVPESIEEHLLNLVQRTTDICSQAAAMIEQLDELLAVGFGGKQSDLVSEMITNVKRDEHNIDVLIRNLNRALFSIEDQMKPVSVMFWYKLIELIGEISNQAENMGDRLMLFIAR